jgi:aryl sulfotransferase
MSGTMQSLRIPRRRRVYQNHTIDSTHWDDFEPRHDDIVIATPYKCGTTWTQGIVSSLVLGECNVGASTWLDFRPQDAAKTRETLAQQEHRRFIKTHLPLDGLPWFRRTKYLVISRDPRDVFMSLFNHYHSYTDVAYEKFNETPGRIGAPIPRCPDDIRQFWQSWISRGWFDWESEGYPYWSNLRHVQTWWDFRQLPNILFVHYNHLQADAPGQIRRIAAFLDLPADAATITRVARETTIDAMRNRAAVKEREAEVDTTGDAKARRVFRDGAHSFFYKGTNGRWREALTETDLELYETAALRELTPECRAWVERGELDVECSVVL